MQMQPSHGRMRGKSQKPDARIGQKDRANAMEQRCIVCGQSARLFEVSDDVNRVDCPSCGSFRITAEAARDPALRRYGMALSRALRRRSSGTLITSANLRALLNEAF